MQGSAPGLSSLAFQSARGRGGGLVAGEHDSCANTAVALNQVLLGGDDKPEAAAERGAKCGATLCYAPAPPSWCQVLCGSRCGRTDAPLGFLKERKPSLPRTTGDQRELLSGPLGAAEGCSVQSKSN